MEKRIVETSYCTSFLDLFRLTPMSHKVYNCLYQFRIIFVFANIICLKSCVLDFYYFLFIRSLIFCIFFISFVPFTATTDTRAKYTDYFENCSLKKLVEDE